MSVSYTADDSIIYSPHRLLITSESGTSPMTIRFQFMPMYGPQEWYDFVPNTQVRRDVPTARESVE